MYEETNEEEEDTSKTYRAGTKKTTRVFCPSFLNFWATMTLIRSKEQENM